jgi:hypothetical protein
MKLGKKKQVQIITKQFKKLVLGLITTDYVHSITFQKGAQNQHHNICIVSGDNITDQIMFLSYLSCPDCVS